MESKNKRREIIGFILVILSAVLVSHFTNSGCDLLVWTWVIGALPRLTKNQLVGYASLGVVSLAVVYVLFNSASWSWTWVDYAVVIERLIAIITVLVVAISMSRETSE